MNLRINGKNEEIEKTSNMAELILRKDLSPEKIVVEHNFNILSKEEWNTTMLNENDNIEILSFVQGG